MAKLSFYKKGWMASIVVLAFLLVAGMNFGTQQETEFYETEVALENAIAGSGHTKKCVYVCDTGGTNIDCKKSGSLCSYDSHCL
ncbi:hypothetical protein [Aquiflexum sp.]|uniref:hypothetical protein n=1 Tax=Aquiflexum sp. TaxID=1872584 RepID=UPI0035931646